MMRGGPAGRAGFLTEEEKKNAPKVTRELLGRVLAWLKPYWKQLLLVLACTVVASVCSLFPSILTGRIVDLLTGMDLGGWIGAGLSGMVKLILLSIGLHLGSSLIGVGQHYLNNWIAQHISQDMRNRMYRHLQRMSQRFFTSVSQGDILTRMTNDITGVENTISNTFTSILSNVITLINGGGGHVPEELDPGPGGAAGHAPAGAAHPDGGQNPVEAGPGSPELPG